MFVCTSVWLACDGCLRLGLTCVHLHRYESAEVALNCGMMLRECLRHEPLARTVLFSEDFFCFFRYVELSTFDIASDAFASFKVLLGFLSNCCTQIPAVSS